MNRITRALVLATTMGAALTAPTMAFADTTTKTSDSNSGKNSNGGQDNTASNNNDNNFSNNTVTVKIKCTPSCSLNPACE